MDFKSFSFLINTAGNKYSQYSLSFSYLPDKSFIKDVFIKLGWVGLFVIQFDLKPFAQSVFNNKLNLKTKLATNGIKIWNESDQLSNNPP